MLRVYIDGPEGVDLDDCATVSYQLSGLLDVEDPIPGQYDLEVSSPGLDRPLFEKRHFEQFAGRQVQLKTQTPHQGRRKFNGLLRGIEGESVMIEQDGEVVRLPFSEIEQARLVPDFD
ncbi:MAG: ribosome maturation factor RimP [Gammaproteobacteria bacterium]